MKEFLLGKCKLKYDEYIYFAEKYGAIIQWKLPPKLTDLGRFTISCYIGSLIVSHALCDLRARINLIHCIWWEI